MSKHFLVKNLGLRIVALLMGIVVWAMITGKERSFSERTMEVSVEYFGVASNIHIRDVNPNKVQVQFRATSRQMEKIKAEDFFTKGNWEINEKYQVEYKIYESDLRYVYPRGNSYHFIIGLHELNEKYRRLIIGSI